MNDQYDNILPALLNWQKEGKKVAVATLIEISGGSPRPIGAQLFVNDDGDLLGAISSGCVEADIILAAREVIKTGEVRHYNYGAGSPFIDLILPCGSRIKILVNMAPSMSIVAKLCKQLEQRQTACLTLDLNFGQWLEYSEQHTMHSGYFICDYLPAKRLIAIGKGAVLQHVIKIAVASGLEVSSHSPDYLQSDGNTTRLNTPLDFKHQQLDAHTAVLVLFHDHDWESPILQSVLKSDACYIGALGSANSHIQRISKLRALGCSAIECQKITSPAGLIQGTRQPQHIALSMVSQVVSVLCEKSTLAVSKRQTSREYEKQYAFA